MSEQIKFTPPSVKYRRVARLVKRGKVEKALQAKELAWLERDVDFWVSFALESPGDFNAPIVKFLDYASEIDPDESSIEARIFQRWSAFPQIKAMLQITGLPKDAMITYIRGRIKVAENVGK